MKSITTLFLVLLLNVSFLSANNISSPDSRVNMTIYEAINKGGFQRMLTQRIAKSYLAIVAEMKMEHHKEQLLGSARVFENNLRDLQAFSPNDEIKNQYRYVEILWENYKFIYTAFVF